MNSLRIRISIDQKAALLAGRVLGPTAEIEISPETIPADVWPTLVGRLNMDATPPTLNPSISAGGSIYSLPAISEATPEALTAAIRAVLAQIESDKRLRAERQEAELAAFEADGINRQKVTEPGGYTWEKWSVAYISDRDSSPERHARVTARREIVAKLAEEHNRAELPAVEAAKAAHAAAEAERKAKEAAEKEAAAAARAAKRLETGLWERETGSYNERRYGAPWCATVVFPGGPKPEYSFCESSGKWGKPGLMVLPCKPGDIIAHGQKDLRRPGDSENTLLIMRRNGRMKQVERGEAYQLAKMPLEARLAALD